MCAVMRSRRLASRPAPSGSTFMWLPPGVVLTGVLAHLQSSRPTDPPPHSITAPPGGQMTDVLERAAEPLYVEPAVARPRATDEPGRVAIASLLVGAAAIHLAMVPAHAGEWALEGAAFIASAWIQLV